MKAPTKAELKKVIKAKGLNAGRELLDKHMNYCRKIYVEAVGEMAREMTEKEKKKQKAAKKAVKKKAAKKKKTVKKKAAKKKKSRK